MRVFSTDKKVRDAAQAGEPVKKKVVLSQNVKPKGFSYGNLDGFKGINRHDTHRAQGPLHSSDLQSIAENKKRLEVMAQKKAIEAEAKKGQLVAKADFEKGDAVVLKAKAKRGRKAKPKV